MEQETAGNSRRQRSRLSNHLTWVPLFIALIGCGGSGDLELDSASENLLSAQELIEQGDHQAALQKLDESIEATPDAWTYFERAKLHAELGNDEKANSDIAAGLKLDGKNSKLLWLRQEMKKPKTSRFKKNPPVGKSS